MLEKMISLATVVFADGFAHFIHKRLFTVNRIIKSSNEDHIRMETAGELAFIRVTNDGNLNLWAHGDDDMIFTRGTGNGTESMRILSNGNVAIGTNDPKGYRLAVNGKTITEEVVVKLNGSWPDYVFEPDYNLPTLADLAQYIKANKHLPEVPTAEEVKENGLSVGEMNAILLKKVEELTLHLIEKEKKINDLEAKLSQVDRMQDEIAAIRKMLIEANTSGNK